VTELDGDSEPRPPESAEGDGSPDGPEGKKRKKARRFSLFALRKLGPRLKPHRKAMAGAVACLVVSAAIGLSFPLVVRYLMDAAFIQRNLGHLNEIALILLGLFAVQGVLNFAEVYLLGATGERVITFLRIDLFSHLLELSPGFFSRRSSGELTSRLTSDCSTLQSLLSQQVAELLRQLLYLIGGLSLLAFLHARLMVTVLAVAPVVVVLGFVVGRYLRKRSTQVQDRLGSANATAQEALTQIPIVQSFVREDWERARYDSRIRSALDAALERAWVRGGFFGAMTFLAFGGIVAVLWEGGRLIVAGQITAGELVSFLLYAVQVAAAITALGSIWSSYQEAQGAAHRVFELLETEPDIADPADPVRLREEGPGPITFENVWFRYAPDDPWALREIDVRIEPGEIVALVGPSGAGKSTFAYLVPRYWDPTRGRITLSGHDLRRLELAELRKRVGIVPQEPMLFAGTVAENIAYGRPSAERGEIEAAARSAHAHEFIAGLPDAYETAVGERGVRLSGGQRQRIAIARIFLKEPEILILDEATSSLDTESERLVEEALEAAMRDRTTIIIAHRLRTVRRADRLLVLQRGRVVEQGAHAELLARDGLYARLYRGQVLEPEEAPSV
jgi:subfamily B ATP-binding cassette protein MsbA